MTRLLRDRTGTSAVEFAVVLPIMLVLLLGGIEIARMTLASRKLVAVTRAAADLTTQYAQVSTSTVTTILNAALLTMTPFPTSTLGIVLSEISTNANGVSTVTWSKAMNANPLAIGSTVTVPSGVSPAGTSVILSQTTYGYVPTFGTSFVGAVTLSDAIYLSPRISTAVPLQ